MTKADIDYHYGDVPNIENLKRDLTDLLLKHKVIDNNNYDVGQVVIHVNSSKVAGVSKNNWKIA